VAKLKTETNTQAMDVRVTAAFQVSDLNTCEFFNTVFEHGQWWISCSNGAQYSVVDATGGPSIDGFDFEEVTPPDEDAEDESAEE
jgi:ribosomal protein S27E